MYTIWLCAPPAQIALAATAYTSVEAAVCDLLVVWQAEVVDTLKRAGLVVGMCGDGGNDCGALRSAHAGLALSDAEASLVSPFTSKTKSVRLLLTATCCAMLCCAAALSNAELSWSLPAPVKHK